MPEYKYLFTPIKLGPITLKNRIVCAGSYKEGWPEGVGAKKQGK